MKPFLRSLRRSTPMSFAITFLFLSNLTLPASARNPQYLYDDTPVHKDYFSLLKNHAVWPKLPITVYFVHDSEYTSARDKAARAGFSLWGQATGGYVGYRVVDSSDRAQITVAFDPSTDDGHTTTTYTSRHLIRARMVLGVDQGSEHDLQCTAAHEFAHALGMSGHSNDSRDLMYPAHIMGRSWSITRRDLNTLAMVYHIDSDVASAWTPQYSATRRDDYRRDDYRRDDFRRDDFRRDDYRSDDYRRDDYRHYRLRERDDSYPSGNSR